MYTKAMLGGNAPLATASKEEKMALKETDDEFKRRGFFKRIFPTPDFLYYKQFFEEDRIINYFVDSRLFAKKRNINPVQLRKYQAMPSFMRKEALLGPAGVQGALNITSQPDASNQKKNYQNTNQDFATANAKNGGTVSLLHGQANMRMPSRSL